MVNKLSIKSLGIVFLVLLLVVVAFIIYDSSHGERSFRSSLVSIDTAKVTSISIYPKSLFHKEVRIFKEGNYWKVNLTNGKSAVVPNSKVQDLLSQLLEVKPESVVGQSEKQWKEFNVDTSGTRVKVFEGGKNTLDLIIGKFTYQQPRTMLTYVRVEGDDNIYQTNEFLDFVFNHDANYFRDDAVVKDNYLSWNKLTFTYPADSSFQLVKTNGKWGINGSSVDSAKIANYLSSLSNMEDPNFIDNPDQSIFRKAEYTLTIQTPRFGAINVSAFADTSNIVITSSQYPDTYFDGKKADFWKRVFVSRDSFIKK
ncbi:MAG: DUF4340 domain-containing protein [Bacteroidetes bacterium]|nr:DUF4340 domain-containing protein [Bacteroidota bacterium]